jgi:site-specific DNA-methyltransferase (adenine-specific)
MSYVQIIHGDCMEAMKEMPDKAFDLAIVDPPYGLNITKIWGKAEFGYLEWEKKEWDVQVPNSSYFKELFRVSKNQIIWGGNYFPLLPTQCWLIWDKGQRNFTLADGEMAWTSFKNSLRIFNYSRSTANNQLRIHPTQKPVALYQWLLKNYAKPGDKILDTHGGSCSLAIACDIMGFDCTIYEIDKDYYEAALDRFNRHKQQTVMEFCEKRG